MEDQLHINRQMISQVLHGYLVTTMCAEFVARSFTNKQEQCGVTTCEDFIASWWWWSATCLAWPRGNRRFATFLSVRPQRPKISGHRRRQVERDVQIEWIFWRRYYASSARVGKTWLVCCSEELQSYRDMEQSPSCFVPVGICSYNPRSGNFLFDKLRL